MPNFRLARALGDARPRWRAAGRSGRSRRRWPAGGLRGGSMRPSRDSPGTTVTASLRIHSDASSQAFSRRQASRSARGAPGRRPGRPAPELRRACDRVACGRNGSFVGFSGHFEGKIAEAGSKRRGDSGGPQTGNRRRAMATRLITSTAYLTRTRPTALRLILWHRHSARTFRTVRRSLRTADGHPGQIKGG